MPLPLSVRSLRLLIGLVAVWSSMGAAVAQQVDAVDFDREILPVLAKRCYPCHGPDRSEAGLRLDRRNVAFSPLESENRAIVPGDVDQSELLRRIASDDEFVRMPPEGKPLSSAQIEQFRRWIAGGAAWEEHWAFRAPEPVEPPAVEREEWVRTPIDAFILARLERRGLEPSPPAAKTELLRRVYFDLTGLPPTPAEVAAFLEDESPRAYERVVDRLLDSQRYGERWARHWLDAVRFAETNSFERDGVKPNAWRYRDYVIRSLNDDKPYDQFVREQLAGDELPQVTRDSIIATGYYRLGLWDDEPADPLQARYDEYDDILSTTSQVFLGLTINCGRCHDHKIDPIPQTDYYRMLAFFHGLRSYGTRGNQRSNNQTDISDPELVAQYQELDRKKEQLRAKMLPLEEAAIDKMPAPDQRRAEGPKRQKLLDEKLEQYLSDDEWRAYEPLKAAYEKLEQVELPPRESALSVNRCRVPPPPTHVLMRGNAHAKGEEVKPGFPAIFGTPDPEIPPAPKGASSAGRRLVLADWIASPDNMLTARVMVNRIWQHHFARGIVRSPNNFGQLGEPPTHPQLLDWLAAEFVRNGWRLKPLHKLIVMSNAYRMSSRGNHANLERDPANDLFWRFDMRRLSAEEVRDAMLAVNGRLNLKMYGPGFYPEISAEVLAGQSRPGAGWGNSSPEERARRSVYIHIKRSLITPLLADFDFPDTDTSCAARFATTQPSQALALVNGEFANEQAAAFAERLRRDAGDDMRARVSRALELALCRTPTTEEVVRGVELIERLETQHGVPPSQALDYYCLVVFSLNEFLYVD